jgi:hypothetical protein
MIIFLDTEFTGLDQAKPDLISIALVDETGREFYAELPPAHYAVQCNEWVHFNVLPLLWGGDYVLSVEDTRDRLTAWIAGIQDQAVIVTDCPDADFQLLRWLLPQWPANVAPVRAHGREHVRWIAVDDWPDNFGPVLPGAGAVLFTDPCVGLDDEAVAILRAMIAAPAPATQFCYDRTSLRGWTLWRD